jgi:3-hydroxyacyl-CoA dehydrogenase/enoyl-CoA hydratase/3-hydroxybutyryl-CoA epimerase
MRAAYSWSAMSYARLEVDSENIATLWLDDESKRVNSLSRKMWTELSACIEQVARSGYARLVIASAKPGTFIVGADLFEIRDMSDLELDEYIGRGQRILQRLESVAIPTIAAINGDCLGGGLELALACKACVAVDDMSIRIGLPETKLGLAPGWGGTVRLRKRVGLEQALPMIASGESIDPRAAARIGLVDAIVSPDQLLDAARNHRAAPVRKDNSTDTHRIFAWAEQKIRESKAADELDAPLKVIEIIRDSITRGDDYGYEAERRAFLQLRRSTAGERLLKVFFDRQAAKKQG